MSGKKMQDEDPCEKCQIGTEEQRCKVCELPDIDKSRMGVEK